MTSPWLIPETDARAAQVEALHRALPRLETARLVLRPATLADYPAWAEIMCGPRGDLVDGPWNTRDAYLDFAQNVASWLLRGYGLWSIEERAEDGTAGVHLGFVAHVHEEGDPEAEIGYLLLERAEGRGIATEATLAVREYAFTTLGQDTLVSYIDPRNPASIAVALKMGATRDVHAEAAVPGTLVYRHRRAA